MKRKFWSKFTKKPDPLIDLDGSELGVKRNATVYLKDATTACRSCGGPCAVFGYTNSQGIFERLSIKCPKCGDILVLHSKQPDHAAEAQRLINRGIVR